MRKHKLLAVDDEQFNLDIMKRHMTKAGFDVILAEDGIAALDVLEKNTDTDVIVLDRMMPRMDGMQFLEKLKSDRRFQDIPVVMQTAAAMSEQVLQGIEAGVHYYLTKPYEAALLVGMVKSALEDSKNKRNMKEEVRKGQLVFGLMRQFNCKFRTIDEAKALALYIANCFPQPQMAVYGLHELLINAIEHGNLGITYAEKTNLVLSGELQDEIERRLSSSQYSNRIASVTFLATEDVLTVNIKDEGEGFDWSQYLELCSDRMTDPHGRGIATARQLSFHEMQYLGSGNEVVCKFNLRR
ncbi:MAG: response regulator [Rhodomicrobium sp.]